MVLLKNDGILPLDRSKLKKIAVIGPNSHRPLLGGYSGRPKYYTSVLDGIRSKVGDRVKVPYAEGCRITIGGSWSAARSSGFEGGLESRMSSSGSISPRWKKCFQ